MEKCQTNIKTYELEYEWTLEKFCTLLNICSDDEESIAIESSPFSTGVTNKTNWHLELYFNGNKHEYKEWISIYLVCEANAKSEIRAHQKYYILDSNKQKIWVKTSTSKFICNRSLGYFKFYKKRDLLEKGKKLLPNDQLTIILKLTIMEEPISTPGRRPLDVPKSQISEDFERLLDDEESSDVTLVVGEEEFRVHKLILIARSPVFAAMFKHEMLEQKENRVNISDVEPDVFRELLRFIYTDKSLNLKEVADGLLPVADKYALDRLKGMCEEALCEKLDINNAAEIYALADRHNAQQLAKHVVEFINANKVAVLDSLGLQSMEESCPHSMIKLHRALSLIQSNPL